MKDRSVRLGIITPVSADHSSRDKQIFSFSRDLNPHTHIHDSKADPLPEQESVVCVHLEVVSPVLGLSRVIHIYMGWLRDLYITSVFRLCVKFSPFLYRHEKQTVELMRISHLMDAAGWGMPPLAPNLKLFLFRFQGLPVCGTTSGQTKSTTMTLSNPILQKVRKYKP